MGEESKLAGELRASTVSSSTGDSSLSISSVNSVKAAAAGQAHTRKDSNSGRWGEQTNGEERVDFDEATQEFEEIRKELSRASGGARRNSIAASKKISIKSSKQKLADEEEGEFDSEASLTDLAEYFQRMNRDAESSGIIPKQIGVSFKNLTVSGTGSGRVYVRTFPEELATIFGKGIYDSIRGLFAEKPPSKSIIQGFSGVVKPGEMLLVLGRPGSGSSTFLRALTNQRRDFTDITGDINYSGLDFELAKGKFRGEIMFNGEEDIHLPTLTVEQTLRFAMRAKTPHKRTPGTSRAEFVEQMLELFAKMFGMTHVLKTMVGNQFIRGVSGGERKRVSIIEALASRATINAWDNSTRGLDSSTAVDYIRSLRILTSITHSTTIVTLYQAGEQIYKEFDKVCVIDSGRQIFFGKASEARGYFESLGFTFPPRSTTADFLTLVTDPNERRITQGWEGKIPETPLELETAFRNSRHWTEVQRELAAYDEELKDAPKVEQFSQAVKEDKSRRAPKGSPYTVSFPLQVWYLVQRELQLQLQDKTAIRSHFINTVVMGLILGSLFWQIPRTSAGAFAIGGALFFNFIVLGWLQMIEAINMAVGRSIISKQTTFAFYRPSAVVLARTFADLPLLVAQCTIFTIILYFMAGLDSDAGKFFLNWLFVVTMVICMTAFFRAVGAFSKDVNVSIRAAFLGLNIMGLFAGYMQSQFNMKSWVYKWIFYAVPLSYGQEALMANQFDGIELECSPAHLIPGVPGASIRNQVCSLPGAVPMSSTVSGTLYIREQFGYEASHIWRNYGIIWLFTIGYLVIAMIGVEVLSFGAGGASIKVFTKKAKINGEELPTKKTETEKVTEPSGNIDSEKHPQKQSGAAGALERMSTARSGAKTNGSVYSWTNVNYTVSVGNSEKQLLHNVSGYVKPGRLTALMGASGAGKTTLLDNLAHRKRVGVVSGEFLMDGKSLMRDFERSTGFVEQQDVHDGTATVREALRFSALLRQPETIPQEEKYAFVEDLIVLLELEHLADALIGEPAFGLSVEERKRVTIGVELAAKPEALLFLDEPTSGLDSNGALSIVRFLRKLADESSLAILCTIHQPSAILLQDFDDMLLLARGGRQVYFGPIGEQGDTVIDYFERNGARKADPDANPAEYILETTRIAPGPEDWPTIWDRSPEAHASLEEIESLINSRTMVPSDHMHRDFEFAMPLHSQIIAVTKRVWLHYWRDASYGYSKMFSNLSMAIVSGVLFLNSGNTVLEMQSRGFAIFVVLILLPMVLTAIQPKFLQFRTLYETRERNSKIYSAPAFITAMVLVEIPYAILGTVFFFLPWYYMIGMPTDSSRAGYEFLLLLLFEIFIPHFAMWIAAMCENMTMISIVNPFIFCVTNGFTGILVAYSSLPYFYRSWLYWVNPLTWLVRGLLSGVLHGVEVECSEKEFVRFQPPEGQTCGQYAGEWVSSALGKISNLDAMADCKYCQFKSGDEYLKTINIEYSTRWRDLGIFAAYIFSNVALIYILYWAVREFRWRRFFSSKLKRTSKSTT